GWQHTDLQNVGTTLVATVPTADQRAGNFGSTVVRDPLTGQPFPNNQIPISRFDPASVNVLKYLPIPGPDGRLSVPRRIRTPPPLPPGAHRHAGQPVRGEGRSSVEREGSAERPVFPRSVPQRSDLHGRQPPELPESDARRDDAHAERGRRLAAHHLAGAAER